MYCPSCGQLLAAGQPVCPGCGRSVQPIASVVAAPTLANQGRVLRHIQPLAILWLVYAAFSVVTWLALIPFLKSVFGGNFHGGAMVFPFGPSMAWLIPYTGVMVCLRAGLQVLTGVGLMMHQRWARVLGIIVAILSLIKIPLGTALGIYTLWVLAPHASGVEFDQIAED